MTLRLLGLTVTVAVRRRARPALALTETQAGMAGGRTALDGYTVVGYPLGSRTNRISDGWGWER